jgi:hypothetical protein
VRFIIQISFAHTVCILSTLTDTLSRMTSDGARDLRGGVLGGAD